MPNLLLVTGTGRKSGKTTMVCRITGQFREIGIISVKISPHFHEPSEGLKLITGNQRYLVYEETNPSTSKDTSQMLKIGAERVFFIEVSDGYLEEAFSAIVKIIPENRPVVCESPGLYKYLRPGVFVIMIADNELNYKDITEMKRIPHAEFTLQKLSETAVLPFKFGSGGWNYSLGK